MAMLILKKPQFNKYYIDFPAKEFTRASKGHFIMIRVDTIKRHISLKYL